MFFKKIVSISLSITAAVISIISLFVFLWIHTLIGLTLAIVAFAVGMTVVILNLCSKEKTAKSIILPIIGVIVSISILIFEVIGTIKISNMKNEIESEYESWLNDDSYSYIDQTFNIEKVLDLQNSMEAYEDKIERYEIAQKEYDALYN